MTKMAHRLLTSLLCCAALQTTIAQTPHPDDTKTLTEWLAGTTVSPASIDDYGVERCFVASPIDDYMFQRIKGLSYKDDCTVPLSELRHLRLLHYDANGEVALGEMICNRSISDDLLSIFRDLYAAEYRIERVLLVDEYGADDNLSMVNNNSSSFNFRFISGSTRLSRHSLGLAVDINPLYNPYVREFDDRVVVEPLESREYVDRTKEFPFKIDSTDLCCKLFKARGFEWGGDWQSLKDYQHFEKSN